MQETTTNHGVAIVDTTTSERFRRDGVVCLRRALAADTLRLALEAYEWSLGHPGPGASALPGNGDGTFYQDLANPAALSAYRPLLQQPELAAAIAALWGHGPVWFMYEQVFMKSGGTTRRTPWHQDSPYLPVGGDDLAVMWISFDPVPEEQALEFVRTVRSVNIVVDDAVAAKAASAVFSGSVHDCALADALSLLVRPAGFTWQIAEGVVFVTKPGAKPALKKAAPVKSVPRVLETTRLEAGFVSAPLPRVAAWIARSTKFPVRVDPWLTANRSEESLQVDLKTRAIPARTLLDLIAEVESLDWDVRWGGVFITTAERRKALPIDPIPARESGDLEPWEADLRDALAAKKVTLAVEDVSVVEVLALIRDSHGVNVLLAPKAAVAAAKMKATIAVEDVTLGDALSLLLLPRGLTYSLRHEVIVVEPSGK